jgi:hypothetical protein
LSPHKGVLMKLIAVIVFLSVFVSHAFAQIIVPGKVEVPDLGPDLKFKVITLKGPIVSPIADEFIEALNSMPDGTRVVIDFDSEGGQNTEGYKIIKAINSSKARLKIDSFVDNGALCASMCIPLFANGTKRVAGARATFMFHGASPWYTNVPSFAGTKEYTDSLLAAGVSEEWLKNLWDIGIFSAPMEYWANGEELLNEKSNIVTELKPRIIEHEVVSAPFDPQIRPR